MSYLMFLDRSVLWALISNKDLPFPHLSAALSPKPTPLPFPPHRDQAPALQTWPGSPFRPQECTSQPMYHPMHQSSNTISVSCVHYLVKTLNCSLEPKSLLHHLSTWGGRGHFLWVPNAWRVLCQSPLWQFLEWRYCSYPILQMSKLRLEEDK